MFSGQRFAILAMFTLLSNFWIFFVLILANNFMSCMSCVMCRMCHVLHVLPPLWQTHRRILQNRFRESIFVGQHFSSQPFMRSYFPVCRCPSGRPTSAWPRRPSAPSWRNTAKMAPGRMTQGWCARFVFSYIICSPSTVNLPPPHSHTLFPLALPPYNPSLPPRPQHSYSAGQSEYWELPTWCSLVLCTPSWRYQEKKSWSPSL